MRSRSSPIWDSSPLILSSSRRMSCRSPAHTSSQSGLPILSRPLILSRHPRRLRQPCKVHRRLWNRAGYGPSGLAPVVLPRLGLRGDVLHLRKLLPGAGLLWRAVPPPDETPADAACQPEAPGQPGRTARSPGPATDLPGKVPPARDGSYFRPPPPIRQHQGTMDKNAKKAAIGEAFQPRRRLKRPQAAIRAVCIVCGRACPAVIGPDEGTQKRC